MLLRIIEDNENVVVFLKPKRKQELSEVIKHLPQLKDQIKERNIIAFYGDGKHTKRELPVYVGMASDLVIGYGISSAAAECYFAGTLAFHIDIPGYINNTFGNKGLGKIVFRNIEKLESAVQECIDNGTKVKFREVKHLYASLDPFQDGNGYLRVGFILKNLQDTLNQGLSREEAFMHTNVKYSEYLKISKATPSTVDYSYI